MTRLLPFTAEHNYSYTAAVSAAANMHFIALFNHHNQPIQTLI